jgi:hypothetical protein
MIRSSSAAILVVPMAVGVSGPAAVRAQVTSAPCSQRPDAQLTGLTNLGVVVGDLGPQAAVCGLKQDANNLKE